MTGCACLHVYVRKTDICRIFCASCKRKNQAFVLQMLRKKRWGGEQYPDATANCKQRLDFASPRKHAWLFWLHRHLRRFLEISPPLAFCAWIAQDTLQGEKQKACLQEVMKLAFLSIPRVWQGRARSYAAIASWSVEASPRRKQQQNCNALRNTAKRQKHRTVVLVSAAIRITTHIGSQKERVDELLRRVAESIHCSRDLAHRWVFCRRLSFAVVQRSASGIFLKNTKNTLPARGGGLR